MIFSYLCRVFELPAYVSHRMLWLYQQFIWRIMFSPATPPAHHGRSCNSKDNCSPARRSASLDRPSAKQYVVFHC